MPDDDDDDDDDDDERSPSPARGPSSTDQDEPSGAPASAGAEADPRPSSPRSRPKDAGDPLGMQLLKQALFPQRKQQVQIGRYSVLRLIGHGGMGAVYACYDEQLDRKVAVKILQIDGGARSRELASARLVREGQALARLSHPNVVTVHEVGQTASEVYVAMEYVRGVSLDAWAAEQRSWREILAAFVQAGRGLAAAHRVGIVHRDFKPQNVLVNEEGLVKVLDFGLARASGEQVEEAWLESQPDGASASSPELLRPLTRTGALVGTPAYMSPEQYRGELVTAASDQFSFCVSLYQCLYGALPFATASLAQLRGDVLAGRVTPPPLRSLVPARVFKVLRRGLAATPAERYRSMNELLAALDRGRSSRTAKIAAVAVTAAVTGAVGFLVASASKPALEICPDARAELAGVWDEARGEAARAAMRATGSPRVDEVLAIVEPAVDRYADAWAAMRDEACLAHAEGRQAERLFELRTACLEERRASLRALVDEMAAVDAERLAGLAQAAAGLPPIERCGDAAALLASVPAPTDPKVRARVQARREDLARVTVLHDFGKVKEGLALAEEVVADDEAMGHEPFAAEALLGLGFLQWASGDLGGGERTLERAMLTAIRVDHEPVAAQASSRLSYLRGGPLLHLEEARAGLPLVEALNRRVAGDVDLYAEYLNNRGAVEALLGERRAAVEHLEAARDLRARHGRDRTPLALGTLMNLGFLLRDEGRIEAAAETFSQVVGVGQEILGPTAQITLRAEGWVGQSDLELGRPRRASQTMERLLAKAGWIRDVCLWSLAEAALTDGDAARAREHLTAYLALDPTDLNHDMALHRLMVAAARDGDAAAMEAARARAAARLDLGDDALGYRRSMLLLHHGLALLALDRPREALVPLEELRAALPDALVAAEPSVRPRLALALGQAHARAGDPAAAEASLEAALEQAGEGWPMLRAEALRELGEVALAGGRLEAARGRLEAAASLYARTAEPDFTPQAEARFALARALAPGSTTAPPRALEAAEAALAAFRAKGRSRRADEVAAWLAARR